MSRNDMIRIVSIFCVLIMIDAFSSHGAAQTTLDGKWKLTAYGFTPKAEFPIEKMTVDLTVEKNTRIGGKAGCNIYGGSLTLESGGRLKIGPLTSTDMACDEMTNHFESLFLQTLQNATEYSLASGKLTLTDPKTGNFLRFERSKEPPKQTPAKEQEQS